MSDNEIIIYCDGACSGNPGPGGWGAILIHKNVERKIFGYEQETTNNRMELLAAIESLNIVKKEYDSSTFAFVNIYTDSAYVKKGITEWIDNWISTNWKKGTVKNIDLWQKLKALVQNMDIKWHLVKGHSGDKYNDIADKLATDAIKKMRMK